LDPAALALWIFLVLLIGWIGVILVATWMQVREETARLVARDERL